MKDSDWAALRASIDEFLAPDGKGAGWLDKGWAYLTVGAIGDAYRKMGPGVPWGHFAWAFCDAWEELGGQLFGGMRKGLAKWAPSDEPELAGDDRYDLSAIRARIGKRQVIVSVSGGKDSTACALLMQRLGIPYIAVHQDTGWEHADTDAYIRGPLQEHIGAIEIVRAEPDLTLEQEALAEPIEAKLGKSYSSLVRWAFKKGMFPSRQRRWCTEEVKVFPFRDYIRAGTEAGWFPHGVVNVVGIRADESASRAQMDEWGTMNELGDVLVWRPLMAWTEQDVIDIHHAADCSPNPLYLRGASRVGCWPCIFSRKAEVRMMADTDPDRVEAIRMLETAIQGQAAERYAKRGETFESLGYKPPTLYQSRRPIRTIIGWECGGCGRIVDVEDCPDGSPPDEHCPECPRGAWKKITKRKGEPWPIDRVIEWSRTKHGSDEVEEFAPLPHETGCMRWGYCEIGWAQGNGLGSPEDPKEPNDGLQAPPSEEVESVRQPDTDAEGHDVQPAVGPDQRGGRVAVGRTGGHRGGQTRQPDESVSAGLPASLGRRPDGHEQPATSVGKGLHVDGDPTGRVLQSSRVGGSILGSRSTGERVGVVSKPTGPAEFIRASTHTNLATTGNRIPEQLIQAWWAHSNVPPGETKAAMTVRIEAHGALQTAWVKLGGNPEMAPVAEFQTDLPLPTKPRTPTLRPFFSFYGGKWRAAPHYPGPVHDTIIEPFAGSAGYSMRYSDRKVILVERDPVIAATWRYLLSVRPEEIVALPDIEEGQSVDDLDVAEEARWLIGWWINKGAAQPHKTPSKWMGKSVRGETKRDPPTGWWGSAIRTRIAAQIGAIRHWTLIEGDYTDAPDVPAAWFIDPPYIEAGKHYRHGPTGIDYARLADWCRARSGQVIVCENAGADWLPFTHFRDIKANESKHGKKVSREAIWLNTPHTPRERTPTMTKKKAKAPEPTYLNHVKSNMLGGVDLDLHPHTLLVGRNAHGKSAIPKAVEFATRGSVTDLMGKDEVSKHTTLRGLAPEGQQLWSEVSAADKDMGGRRVDLGGKGPVPSGDLTVPIFPLHDLRDLFTTGGADAQRAWFLGRIAGSVTQEHVLRAIPEPLQPEFKAVAKQLTATGNAPATPVDALADVRKEANRLKLEAGREAKAAGKVKVAVAGNAASAPTEATVTEAETKAATLLAEWEALPNPATAPAASFDPATIAQYKTQIPSVTENLGKADATIAALTQGCQELEAQIAAAVPDPNAQAAIATWDALALVVRLQSEGLKAGRMTHCAVCEQHIGSLEKAEEAAVRAANLAAAELAKLGGVDTSALQGELDAKKNTLAQWEHYKTQWTQWLPAAQAQVAAADAVVGGGDSEAATEAYNAARATWQTADSNAKQLRSALDSYAGVAKAQTLKARCEERQGLLGRLVKACDEAIADILTDHTSLFVSAVRKFMPPEDKMPKGGTFDLRLTAPSGGKACDIGLKRGSGLHTCLSGAEWDIVLTAIACAASTHERLAVIIPEERDLDAETLGQWMRSLSKSKAQIIITSTVKPKGRAPAGWKIIDVEELEPVDLGEGPGSDDPTDEEALPPEAGAEADVAPAAEAGDDLPDWAAAALATTKLWSGDMRQLREQFMGGFGVEYAPEGEPVTVTRARGQVMWHRVANGAVVSQCGMECSVYQGTAELG